MSTQIFTERAINPKLDGISTEDLVQELIDRKKAHVDQLSAMVALFEAPAPARAARNGEERARPVPALPPARTSAPAGPPAGVPEGASLNERIVAVLLEEGRGLRTRDITERVIAGGWTTKSPDKGKMVSSAVSAMVAKKALRRRGDLVTLPSTQEAAEVPAKKSAAQKSGTAKKKAASTTPKKTAAPKSAPQKTKAKTLARPPAGKQVADFALAALVETRTPTKLAEVITKMKRAGWTSTAKNAEKMVENVLRKLVAKKKAKSLGSRTFQAIGG